MRLSKALFAVKVQAPAASMVKVPMVPTIVAAVNALSALSGSVAVSVPLVDSAASVSVSVSLAEETVAASLVPLIWI